MALISDVLAGVLGEDPTETAVWRATRRPDLARRVAETVVAAYLSEDLDPLPAKSNTTLRPAFLSDYHGRQDTPYEREFVFVGKSLCYSDEVAVVDEINDLAESPDLERSISDKALGFPECSDLQWILRRIARYAHLERAGLLHFIPRPARQDRSGVPGQLLDAAVRELGPLVAKRHGWDPTLLSNEAGPARAELASWLSEFSTVFDYAAAHSSLFDIYLPAWFAGPELLEWTYKKGLRAEHLPGDVLRQQTALTHLVSLPSPSGHALRMSALTEIPRLREAQQLVGWREQLHHALQGLDNDPSLLGTREFEEHLTRAGDSLNFQVQRSTLRDSLTSTIETGIATAPVAYLFSQDVIGTTAIAAAPAVLKFVNTWLRGGRPPQEEKVGNPKQSATAFRSFLSEPWSPRSRNQAPPTSWMRTPDGQPIAFDLFDSPEDDDHYA